jgi:hypothetical protein
MPAQPFDVSWEERRRRDNQVHQRRQREEGCDAQAMRTSNRVVGSLGDVPGLEACLDRPPNRLMGDPIRSNYQQRHPIDPCADPAEPPIRNETVLGRSGSRKASSTHVAIREFVVGEPFRCRGSHAATKSQALLGRKITATAEVLDG